MIEQVADAIKSKDYQRANQLLLQLQQQEPDNPWGQFYLARLNEATGKLESANTLYRQLLRQTTNPKVIAQTRQGITRIAEIENTQRQNEQTQRQRAITSEIAKPGSKEMGVLVLEPISPELKQTAAQQFAQVMHIDPYTARLQLPSRAWRLYRTGAIGELQFYTTSLRQAEIPCFCFPLSAIAPLKVYPVSYFESVAPQATVVYQIRKGQQASLSFKWTEVSQRVEALLPLFEECVEMDVRHKLQRKTKTLDYAQFCDLHLPGKNSILRICDQNYQFQQGINFSENQKSTDGRTTTRDNWNHFSQFLKQQLPEIPVWPDFSVFAETAIDFREMLKLIEPHVDLLRREDTPWDAAFHLYSGLVFALEKGKKTNNS